MTANAKHVPVSVIVPIKNEAGNLPRCLESVRWADEIFVVDSQSTDGSVADRSGTRRAGRAVSISMGRGRRKRIGRSRTCLSGTNGSSFSTPTRSLPPEAEEEFARAIANAGEMAGYWINRRFMFMGRWLRHAYYPNWNLRLFRHALGRYEKLTDADTHSGDNEVHEHVIVQGPTGRLRCEMDHYAFPSVEVFVEKHNRYSNWEARVSADRQLSGSAAQIRSGHGRTPSKTEAAFAAPAVPSAPPFPLHLRLAERFSRRSRRLLFRPAPRAL